MIFICEGSATKWQAEVFGLPKKTAGFGLFDEIYTFGYPLTGKF